MSEALFTIPPAQAEQSPPPTKPEMLFEIPPAARELGTVALQQPEVNVRFDLDYRYAKIVSVSELSRGAGNDEKPAHPQYVENQKAARSLFVDSIQDGSLYESTPGFMAKLQEAHALAAADDVYSRANQGPALRAESVGKFRGEGMPYNHRGRDAQHAMDVAVTYGDPYVKRFAQPQNGMSESVVNLPGIDRAFLPKDIYAPTSPDKPYTFQYPDGKGIPQYMEQITQLGAAIQLELKQPQIDHQKVVELIGRQYQYGAIVRPFNNINNSLFMNLANAQLKLIGAKPLTHAHMDMVAQRLQPETFVKYFSDRAYGHVK